MCLAIPARIIKIKENGLAEIDIGGVTREASLLLVPEAKEGEYVLIHTGYAIQVINEEEARETLKLLKELDDSISQ